MLMVQSTYGLCSTFSPQTLHFTSFNTILGNLAIGRNAIQSSTHLGWEAGKAIDGIKNNWAQCSSTGYATNPFWRLDLVNIYRVHRVVVTNRIDCCPEHINGAVIRVGNSLENNGSNNSMWDSAFQRLFHT